MKKVSLLLTVVMVVSLFAFSVNVTAATPAEFGAFVKETKEGGTASIVTESGDSFVRFTKDNQGMWNEYFEVAGVSIGAVLDSTKAYTLNFKVRTGGTTEYAASAALRRAIAFNGAAQSGGNNIAPFIFASGGTMDPSDTLKKTWAADTWYNVSVQINPVNTSGFYADKRRYTAKVEGAEIGESNSVLNEITSLSLCVRADVAANMTDPCQIDLDNIELIDNSNNEVIYKNTFDKAGYKPVTRPEPSEYPDAYLQSFDNDAQGWTAASASAKVSTMYDTEKGGNVLVLSQGNLGGQAWSYTNIATHTIPTESQINLDTTKHTYVKFRTKFSENKDVRKQFFITVNGQGVELLTFHDSEGNVFIGSNETKNAYLPDKWHDVLVDISYTSGKGFQSVVYIDGKKINGSGVITDSDTAKISGVGVSYRVGTQNKSLLNVAIDDLMIYNASAANAMPATWRMKSSFDGTVDGWAAKADRYFTASVAQEGTNNILSLMSAKGDYAGNYTTFAEKTFAPIRCAEGNPATLKFKIKTVGRKPSNYDSERFKLEYDPGWARIGIVFNRDEGLSDTGLSEADGLLISDNKANGAAFTDGDWQDVSFSFTSDGTDITVTPTINGVAGKAFELKGATSIYKMDIGWRTHYATSVSEGAQAMGQAEEAPFGVLIDDFSFTNWALEGEPAEGFTVLNADIRGNSFVVSNIADLDVGIPNKVQATVSVTNPTNDPKSVMIILAGYNDNDELEFAYTSGGHTVPANTDIASVVASMPINAVADLEGMTIRAFCIDNYNMVTPLYDVAPIQ